MSYQFEVIESGVRHVVIEPNKSFPEGYSATYLVCVGHESQGKKGCYVGTVWNTEKKAPAVVGNRGEYRRRMHSEDEAYGWWQMVMSPSKYEEAR